VPRGVAVGFGEPMPSREASINDPAVPRNQQSDMRAPGALGAIHGGRPHGRMHRGADVAKQMGASRRLVKTRGDFPVEPTMIMLLGGKQYRLGQRLVPGP
jgi:hypothetical protein